MLSSTFFHANTTAANNIVLAECVMFYSDMNVSHINITTTAVCIPQLQQYFTLKTNPLPR